MNGTTWAIPSNIIRTAQFMSDAQASPYNQPLSDLAGLPLNYNHMGVDKRGVDPATGWSICQDLKGLDLGNGQTIPSCLH